MELLQKFSSASCAVPSQRQLAYQDTELNALLCYGLAPFTGDRFGSGYVSPEMFWPESLDVDGWIRAIKSACFSGVIMVAKHYDGFCLWQTKMTDYSVASSNWENGQGDLVYMVQTACRKYGLKFGISLAPWDMHEKTYGSGPDYDRFFMGLLTELLTGYGDIYCVRLDGVCGAEIKQDYDWDAYYSLIRSLAPDAVITFAGPDIRWAGNDKGYPRTDEWSAVPSYLGVDPAVRPAKKALTVFSNDLGSSKVIKNTDEFIWYPCEHSVPMRPSWFYTFDDKYAVKIKDTLNKLYYATVGANCNLLLGVSPNKQGKLDETDEQVLASFGHDLKVNFGYNLIDMEAQSLSASSESDDGCSCSNLIVNDDRTWRPLSDDKEPELEVVFKDPVPFDKIVLMEQTKTGQHVESFSVFYENEKGKLKKLFDGGVIGHKRIIALKPMQTRRIIVRFTSYREFLDMRYFSIN